MRGDVKKRQSNSGHALGYFAQIKVLRDSIKFLRDSIKFCATIQKFCAIENGLILRIFDEMLREKSFYFANNKCAIGPP
jgi:hypothetical protein